MLIKKTGHKGFSLIELLIALVLALLVTVAAITIYVKNMQSQTENIQLIRLNQDMRAMMDLMVRDIRRSGFVTNAPDSNFDCLKSNPFNKLAIFATGTASVGSSCIVFAYNIDDDIAGGVCTIESTDRMGYRVTGGALQQKTAGGTEASCATGTWETISGSDTTFSVVFTLSEKEIDITEMFSDADQTCNVGEACNGCAVGNQCLTSRDVSINLTGTLGDGTSQTITEKVRVRNDEFDEIH